MNEEPSAPPNPPASKAAKARRRKFGRQGRQFNRRSPFFIGMAASAGVAVTYGLVQLLIAASSILILVGLALFLAVGMEPGVAWLTRHRIPRPAAVVIIAVGIAAAIGGFLTAAIPPLLAQATALSNQLPDYLHQLGDHSSTLGRLNDRIHLQDHLKQILNGDGSALAAGVLNTSGVVLGAIGSFLTVLVLSVYFLASLPRVKQLIWRLFPHQRRARAAALGEEIFAKVGGFVLGNLITSIVAGIGTYAWLLTFAVPYPLLLALFVAIMDLIPIIGSTIAGTAVTLVALTVSAPVAIATGGFYITYRLAEDYLLVPRIMGHTVNVPGSVTLIAVLLGGTLMGIPGALVAIPAAAAIRLLLEETVFPRLDQPGDAEPVA